VGCIWGGGGSAGEGDVRLTVSCVRRPRRLWRSGRASRAPCGPGRLPPALSPNSSAAGQLYFPSVISGLWGGAPANATDPWRYGYVVAEAVADALTQSMYATYSFTTPDQIFAGARRPRMGGVTLRGRALCGCGASVVLLRSFGGGL